MDSGGVVEPEMNLRHRTAEQASCDREGVGKVGNVEQEEGPVQPEPNRRQEGQVVDKYVAGPQENPGQANRGQQEQVEDPRRGTRPSSRENPGHYQAQPTAKVVATSARAVERPMGPKVEGWWTSAT